MAKILRIYDLSANSWLVKFLKIRFLVFCSSKEINFHPLPPPPLPKKTQSSGGFIGLGSNVNSEVTSSIYEDIYIGQNLGTVL